MQELPDFDLMALVQQGRQEAFAVLIRRHQTALVNFFRRMGVNNDADDLVQETFLRVFRYRARYKPSAKFTTFLYTLARNVWTDRWRKLKRMERLKEKVEEAWVGSEQERTTPSGNRLDAQAALQLLPEKLRLVLVMSLYQGMNYEEIGAALAIPVGTVKSRVFLALQRLREVFHES